MGEQQGGGSRIEGGFEGRALGRRGKEGWAGVGG